MYIFNCTAMCKCVNHIFSFIQTTCRQLKAIETMNPYDRLVASKLVTGTQNLK